MMHISVFANVNNCQLTADYCDITSPYV